MFNFKFSNTAILFFLAMLSLGLLPVFWTKSLEPGNLEVYFFDVGQAESVFIKTPEGSNILIDGGYDDTVIQRLDEVMDPWDRTIDLMILTHPHDDHVTGLVECAKRYKVVKTIATGALHSAPNYLAWLSEIKEKNIPMLILDRPRTMQIGSESYLEFIYPDESFYQKESDNLNNTSIALKLIHKNVSFFLGGDIEKEVEEKLLAKNIDLHSNIMKASHHGSDTSNTEAFISAVSPQYCVMTIGQENPFNLPSRRVLQRFLRADCIILRTDQNGTIKFTSDGEEVKYSETDQLN